MNNTEKLVEVIMYEQEYMGHTYKAYTPAGLAKIIARVTGEYLPRKKYSNEYYHNKMVRKILRELDLESV